MDLLTELARLQAESAALRDRVGKLERLVKAWRQCDRAEMGDKTVPLAVAVSEFNAAAKAAGVEP